MKRFSYVLGAALTLASPAFASADPPLTLKGVHLGMSEREYAQIVSKGNFTLAGIHNKYDGPSAKFENGRLVSWAFFFNSEEFDAMLETTRDKYQELECKTSTVQTSLGVEHQQIRCYYHPSEGEMLNLTRFVNRVTTSVIGLTDREWLRKNSEQQQASRAGDM